MKRNNAYIRSGRGFRSLIGLDGVDRGQIYSPVLEVESRNMLKTCRVPSSDEMDKLTLCDVFWCLPEC